MLTSKELLEILNVKYWSFYYHVVCGVKFVNKASEVGIGGPSEGPSSSSSPLDAPVPSRETCFQQ